MLFTVWNTQRGSWSSLEKRKGEIEVTRKRRGGVKRGETILASNQLPKCFLQPRTPKEIHRVIWRREEGGERGDQEERRGSQKERDQASQ